MKCPSLLLSLGLLVVASLSPAAAAEPILDISVQRNDELVDTSKFNRALQIQEARVDSGKKTALLRRTDAIAIAHEDRDPLFAGGACTWLLLLRGLEDEPQELVKAHSLIFLLQPVLFIQCESQYGTPRFVSVCLPSLHLPGDLTEFFLHAAKVAKQLFNKPRAVEKSSLILAAAFAEGLRQIPDGRFARPKRCAAA